MKKIMVMVFMLMIVLQLVNAAEVCVIADYGSSGEEPDSTCIDIDEGKSGYELLEDTNFGLLWSPASAFGRMICKIDDIGTDVDGQYCAYSGEYWNLALNRDGKWLHLPVGLDAGTDCWNYDMNSWDGHYCTKDGDVVALAFGESGAEPKMFSINVSKVYVDGDKQTDSKTRGGKIVKVFPGSKIEVKLEFENYYNSDTDIEVKDISVEAVLEEVEDGDDIEQDLGEFDLVDDKKTTESIEFDIPLEVEEKDRLMKITIEAEDDAGIQYDKEITFDVEIEKENHDLKIMKSALTRTSYTCGQSALLDFSILNIGSNDEDVTLSISNSELEIEVTDSFELEEGAYESEVKFDKKYNIRIPAVASAGTYTLDILAKYGSEGESTSLDLKLDSCKAGNAAVDTVKETEDNVEVNVIKEDSDKDTEVIASEKPNDAKEIISSITMPSNMPLILGGILLVLIVAIIVLGGFLFIKR